ncbi:MAG TPA: cytochrome C biogenesis protein [Elusimicrobia bacterium]|jgi:cytochrome c-type biogenesis protein|nr:cytochrome C biogenesis protein [Elusimicrobiota bacterium]
MTNVPLIASFVAGIATFLSPCVLPLIPAYLSFITGYSLEELKEGEKNLKPLVFYTLFFVSGFTFIFILFGASATYLGNFLAEKREYLRIIGGIIIIFLGLHLTGTFHFKFLDHEKRIHLQSKPLGYFGSFIAGVAFASGWTPCVGPILSSILILASNQETVFQGMLLLFVYSLGLGVPFLLVVLAVNRFLLLFAKVKKFIRITEIVAGVILVILGILLVTNRLHLLQVSL